MVQAILIFLFLNDEGNLLNGGRGKTRKLEKILRLDKID